MSGVLKTKFKIVLNKKIKQQGEHHHEKEFKNIDEKASRKNSGIFEGSKETLTLIRVNAPNEIRKSLGCTNAIENMNGLIRKTT